MKFSQEQIDLLSNYLNEMQIKEIKAYVPVITDEKRCVFMKKDGKRCKNRKKIEEFCSVHCKKKTDSSDKNEELSEES
jgi:predicted transcriptional regulator